ncbi:hypothetical protein APS_2749 [Acetobacter pasteurianus subsp. pasteurianus LMG 1262 = NBRC 106471]|nr:hypothetical protein APS_2749 [Acetobacter pasteurianus subsp. pasteurianus LMG 1262 = NBRC 106471]
MWCQHPRCGKPCNNKGLHAYGNTARAIMVNQCASNNPQQSTCKHRHGHQKPLLAGVQVQVM